MSYNLTPPPIQEVESSFIFKEWLNNLYRFLGSPGETIPWDVVSKTGSELQDIATRPHLQLQDVFGNADQFHVSSEQQTSYDSIETKTGDYTATAVNGILLCDTSSTSFTITLPDATSNFGKEIEVVKTSSANRLTVIPTGADTIVGDTSVIIFRQWTALRFKAVTGNWIII